MSAKQKLPNILIAIKHLPEGPIANSLQLDCNTEERGKSKIGNNFHIHITLFAKSELLPIPIPY